MKKIQIFITIFCLSRSIFCMDLDEPNGLKGLQPDDYEDSEQHASAGPGTGVIALGQAEVKANMANINNLDPANNSLLKSLSERLEHSNKQDVTGIFGGIDEITKHLNYLQSEKCDHFSSGGEWLKSLLLILFNKKTNFLPLVLNKIGDAVLARALRQITPNKSLSKKIVEKIFSAFSRDELLNFRSEIFQLITLGNNPEATIQSIDLNLLESIYQQFNHPGFIGCCQNIREIYLLIKQIINSAELKKVLETYDINALNDLLLTKLNENGIKIDFDFKQIFDSRIKNNSLFQKKVILDFILQLLIVIPDLTIEHLKALRNILLEIYPIDPVVLDNLMISVSNCLEWWPKIKSDLPMLRKSNDDLFKKANLAEQLLTIENDLRNIFHRMVDRINNCIENINSDEIQKLLFQKIKFEGFSSEENQLLKKLIENYSWEYTLSLHRTGMGISNLFKLRLLLPDAHFNGIPRHVNIDQEKKKYNELLFEEVSTDCNLDLINYLINKVGLSCFNNHIKDKNGNTILNLAIKLNRFDLVKLILAKDMDQPLLDVLTEPDNKGNGPIDSAFALSRLGRPEIFALLMQLTGNNEHENRSANPVNVTPASTVRQRKWNVCSKCMIL